MSPEAVEHREREALPRRGGRHPRGTGFELGGALGVAVAAFARMQTGNSPSS